MEAPPSAVRMVAAQLGIDAATGIDDYGIGRQRLLHAAEIRAAYGYVEISEPRVGFRLTRWLYSLCWAGTDRPGVLFEHSTAWLVTHKVRELDLGETELTNIPVLDGLLYPTNARWESVAVVVQVLFLRYHGPSRLSHSGIQQPHNRTHSLPEEVLSPI